MMRKNGHRHCQWLRFIGLLISCLGLGANSLWAQRIVVLDPIDFDPTKAICGFDFRNRIKICLTDANDTCIWTTSIAEKDFGHFAEQPTGKHGDTNYFYFAEEPQTADIQAKMGTNNYKLSLTMVKKAAPVQEITWDPPICEKTEMEFRITPIDLGYKTDYGPSGLHFRWALLWNGLDEMDGNPTFVNVQNDDDFKWTPPSPIDAEFKDGKVVVRPYTCDGPEGKQYRTAEKTADLTPFVAEGLYVDKRIHRLKPKESGGGETTVPTDNWELDGSEAQPNTTICRFYDEQWNKKYGVEERVGYLYLGFAKEEFEQWLEAGTDEKRKLLPEYYYSYEWTFDEEEFEFATDKMNAIPIDQGFGENKSRVVLRVLEGRNHGVEKTHSVTLKVKCQNCIDKSGKEEAFTYTTSLDFTRQDSLLDFASFPIEYDVRVDDEVCADAKTNLEIYMDPNSRSKFQESNATGFARDIYKTLNPPESANWEQTGEDQQKLIYTYKTAQTDWDGTPGRWVTVVVTPANSCFANEGSTMKKVFVKNKPVKPVLFDAITQSQIEGQYTPAKWEKWCELHPDDCTNGQEIPERVMVCNYTAWQWPGGTTAWLEANQTYGLYVAGDSLRVKPDAENGEAFGIVDYNDVLKKGESKLTYAFENRKTATEKHKDSSWVRLSVNASERDYFIQNGEIQLGFYTFNACGTGDTGIFFIRIIDTLTTQKIWSNVGIDGWDTLCEGTGVDLHSTSRESYFTLADVEQPYDYASVNTDRVDYKWTLPEDWTFTNGSTDVDKDVSVRVGRNSGPVQLKLGNRCGYGKDLDSNVLVYPFVRVNIVGDTTPCEGDSIGYRFKKMEGANAYQWRFPDDWEIVSQPSVEGRLNVGVCDQSSADAQDTISIGVRVGATRGEIYVVGKDTTAPGLKILPMTTDDIPVPIEGKGCNFQFYNYETHNIDSLDIRVKPWTSRPILDSKPDTVCADNLYMFSVKKGSDDDDSVFFRWFLPDGWTEQGHTKDYDTATILTSLLKGAHSYQNIRVASSRYDCDATNKGDTLDIPVWFTDTIKVAGRFMDANGKDKTKRANATPCEGDTVYYTLQAQDKEAYYAAFDIRPLNMPDEAAGVATLADGDGDGDDDGDGDGDGDGDDEGDEPAAPDPAWTFLEESGWKMLSDAPYHDTVKMVVGREPILLRAALVSHCDTSSFKQDTVWPISKVIARGGITADRPDDNLCEYEAVDFLFEQVPHATHYVFHYPWGSDPSLDTVRVADSVKDRAAGRLTEDGHYKIHFADTFAYDKGVVYLEAYNKCGVRPQNDTLKIAAVLAPPAVPVLAQVDFEAFGYDAFHVIGADTVLDTVCLRKPVVLEAGPNDKAAAEAAGWQFHYKWDTVRADTSIKVFEKYVDAGWAAGDGLNAGDSLWTMTKVVSPTKVNYLWLTSRHETCQRFGDTLTIALRNIDTTALQGDDRIWNYLYDKESQSDSKRIQTKPCASTSENVAYYLDLKKLDITGESYYFRWRKDSAQDYANVCDADNKLAGGGFVLQELPAGGDWTKLDTLKMTLPSTADTLEIQVVVINRCGEEAQMPGLRIQTSDAITDADRYAVELVSGNICDKEKLTFKVVSLSKPEGAGEGAEDEKSDGIAKAGQYIWHAPWREKADTTDHFTISYDTSYKAGSVSVEPVNGCNTGHPAAVEILADEILRPPMRVQPVDFASGYDPAGETAIAIDSLCLRSDFGMTVKAMLTPSVDAPETEADGDADKISYAWTTVYGVADSLKVNENDSTKATVNVPDFADSAYIIYVAARRSVCQRYGDSLRIELFPMDTIRFINDLVEDDQPYDRFVVLTAGAIRDTRPTPALDTISTTPCVGSAHTYAIKPDFHWSLSPDYTSTFSWNGGKTGPKATGVLDGTEDWLCDDVDRLPTVISIGRVGAASDVLNLSVHAHNICGASVSKPLPVRPLAQIDVAEKPETPYVVGSLCEKDTIRVAVKPVENATGYIWKASWLPKTDTTVDPEIAYADFERTDGNITVYGFNACGDGVVSEALELRPLLYIPKQPEAQWFGGLQMVGDTVYDTLCLYGNNLLWVKAAFDDEADDGVVYEWQLLPDYDGLATLTAGGGSDSVYVTPISYNPEDRDMELKEDDNLYLMVAARRASCRYWSDTLYIALNMTDTVPVSDLGRLIWYETNESDETYTEKEAPKEALCPGTEVRIGVENRGAAPAYRWQFPDDDPTWHFVTGVDPTGAVVRVIVGEKGGVIRVSPMTDPDNRRCAYYAENNALTSSTIVLKEALHKPDFANTFNATPCAGTELTYTVQPRADERDRVDRYRWEFPKGWRIYDAAGNLMDTNRWELKDETCRVLPDSMTGNVKVSILSLCDAATNSFSVSQPAEAAVSPMDTARLKIVADETVCKDSTLDIFIEPLNAWTYGTGYDLSVVYIGSDAAVVNPEHPLTFDFPNAPDSTVVKVGWYSDDSVRLTFTPRHTGGCSNVLPVTYALRADTVPAIEGYITGPERICMGAEATFEATATNLEEGVEVSYHWEVLEAEGWEIVSGADEAVAVIKAGWYGDVTEVGKVVRCYPRALCGTAAPFEYTVKVNPPAEFNGSLAANYIGGTTPLTPADRPCIGSNLAFVLNDLTDHAVPDIRYVWETPDGWERLSVRGTIVDSMLLAEFTAAKAGVDTVRVRFLELNNPLSCGLSAPVGYAVAVRDSAPKATLTRLPYPCNTHTEITFLVAADEEIDSVYWTVPDVYDADKSVTTAEGSAIIGNRLTLKSPTGFPDNFPLVLRSVNVCGTRDTSMTVRPVGPIPDFVPDSLKISHYCPADSGYAYVLITEAYIDKGTSYHWYTGGPLTKLQDSLLRENDDPSGAEKLAWMRFAGGVKATDTGDVNFYARNDCNFTDTVTVRTAPYTYKILAKPGEDTVVYGRSGVSLAVVSTQYGTPADYTYVWQPEDRVTLSNPAAPDAAGTTFATKGLYNPYEYFRVISTERIDETLPFYFGRSACVAFDTVKITVDSTFAMAMAAMDTACMDVSFEISAHPYGGNSERYYFDWYRLVGDSVYEPIADDDHTGLLTLMADAPVIKLMVVGRDSTFVYADGETPDKPEEPENPDTPEDQPEVEDTENPENPEEPVAPPLGEPLYVFSKVDTQYVEVQVFNIAGHLVQPGREEIKVPFGTKVKLMVETTEGSGQYAYLWTPAELLDRHDSTMTTVTTLRLYDNCSLAVTVRDLVTGCLDTSRVDIRMSNDIGDIPNAFSPNGDGINDIFMKGADVIIFDRFGQELFRSTHQEGWDGTYKGKTVAPGEYLYVVTLKKNGQEYVKKGTVSVFTK